MLGKSEGRRRKGQQRMRWLYDITDLMDISLRMLTGWTLLLGQVFAGNFFDYQPIRERHW